MGTPPSVRRKMLSTERFHLLLKSKANFFLFKVPSFVILFEHEDDGDKSLRDYPFCYAKYFFISRCCLVLE